MTTLNIHHIARVEGHGNVDVKVKEGAVEHVVLRAIEPARFFEAMVAGRHFSEVPLIVSRICGICSPNHTVTSLLAIEDALGIEVTDRSKALRQLLVYGSYLQNHATHLYLLAAPDYLNLPSALPLAESKPEVLARALQLKKLGNDLCTIVGGRQVHPITAVVGGFTDEPSARTLELLAARLRAAVRDAATTVELFAGFDLPDFAPDREMLALFEPDNYATVSGLIRARKAGWEREARKYQDFIEEAPDASGNAKFSRINGEPFMTGALARVNLSWEGLLPSARVAATKAGVRPGESNPYKNNLCQAIELVDAAERCARICDELAQSGGDSSSAVGDKIARAGKGGAATEAPRGTLYHSIELDDEGRVIAGDVITPTAQNLACIEADLACLTPHLAGLTEAEFIRRIEELIRAYDPCLSCAVH